MTVLFQPRYPYGKPTVYLPVGLMNLGSRLLGRVAEILFFDLNFVRIDADEITPALHKADVIGFSIIGPPYISEVIGDIRALRTMGFHQPILIGGEGVTRMHPQHFLRWFSGLGTVIQIRNDEDIKHAFGITSLPSAFETSMVPMLERLSETSRRRYLTSEFSLFMSQGCKFGCGFCAAAKEQREMYRTHESLRDEVTYICGYLQTIRHGELRVYLSNLDAFQHPKELEGHLRVISEIADAHAVTLHIRCLATSRCTVEAVRADFSLLGRLRGYGLRTVAFGADGADERSWKRENKSHNQLSELEEARVAMQKAGITVEFLMVIGFQDDDLLALWHDIVYSIRKALQGVILRFYLGKSKTPSGRWPQDDPEVEAFLRDSSLLTRLDYAMVGSPETHPRWRERWMANITYLGLILFLTPLGRNTTFPLLPVPRKGMGKWLVQYVNRLMPFDR